jgi:hypothetical protein
MRSIVETPFRVNTQSTKFPQSVVLLLKIGVAIRRRRRRCAGSTGVALYLCMRNTGSRIRVRRLRVRFFPRHADRDRLSPLAQGPSKVDRPDEPIGRVFMNARAVRYHRCRCKVVTRSTCENDDLCRVSLISAVTASAGGIYL